MSKSEIEELYNKGDFLNCYKEAFEYSSLNKDDSFGFVMKITAYVSYIITTIIEDSLGVLKEYQDTLNIYYNEYKSFNVLNERVETLYKIYIKMVNKRIMELEYIYGMWLKDHLWYNRCVGGEKNEFYKKVF